MVSSSVLTQMLAGNETVKVQAASLVNIFGNATIGENIVSHIQGVETNVADRFRKEVEIAVAAVEKEMHNRKWTAMDSKVILRFEMAVRSITGSSGCGPSNTVQKLGLGDFSGNTKKSAHDIMQRNTLKSQTR